MTKLWRGVITGLKLRRLTAHRHSCLSQVVVHFCAHAVHSWMNKVLRVSFRVCVCVIVRGFQGGRCKCVAALCFQINGSLRGKLPSSWQVLTHTFTQSISTLSKVLIKWCYLWNLLTEVLWVLLYNAMNPYCTSAYKLCLFPLPVTKTAVALQ